MTSQVDATHATPLAPERLWNNSVFLPINFDTQFEMNSPISHPKDWRLLRCFARCLSLHGRFQFLVFLALMILWLAAASNACAQVTRSFTEPVEFSNVAAAEPGVLGKILVREGDRVTIGQTLAELDNQVLQQSMQIAQLRAQSNAKVRSAEANLRLNKQKYEKLRPLLQRGHANNAEVEKAESEYESALAEFELAKQESDEDQLEVQRIQAQINQRLIQSPIDGLVTELHHRKGEYISTNSPQVATVVKLDQLRVRFYLHAEQIQSLAKDQRIRLLVGDDKQVVFGVVEFISPVTDSNSGTTRIDLLIENSNMRLRSGTPCHWQPENGGVPSP